MKSIYHRLLIQASIETVYDALTLEKGLAGWWTPDTTAQPETGRILRFAFGPEYFKEMKVTRLEPPQTVEWLCIKGYEDWIGTTVTFQLQSTDKGTVLSLRHDGWKEYTPGFASCSYDWALFLRSLRLLCETGKGIPYPYYN
ncbi:SRPBCC domain-containing protein [Chitinophaga sp.]|uniref:SRPBCC family protein n=1 Tax=Chitinophaga sp. TaxID=1869181 RepID=UPI0031E09CC3